MDDNENNLLCITVTGPNQDLREKVQVLSLELWGFTS